MRVGDVRSIAPRPVIAGPVAVIDELLARKPNARIAIVQGSFDWFHSGHLDLVSSVASAANKYDLVVVVPTAEYARKPYLQHTFDRRVSVAQQAIAERPELMGRVAVSDAARVIASNPADLVLGLAQAYPGASFAYALGADSFNDSADHTRWPGFDRVEAHPRVDLVAVGRPGYAIQDAARAAHCLGGKGTEISSTEIRRALYSGDLASIRDRVPPSTYEALLIEAARIAAQRPAGAALLGLTRPSEKTFESLRVAIPQGAPNLLDMVEERELEPDVREHLATQQERVNIFANELVTFTFWEAPVEAQIDKVAGYSAKVVLNSKMGTRLTGRYLHKPMESDIAAKVEGVTLLANVMGVSSPLVLTHDPSATASAPVSSPGVSVRWIEDLTVAGKEYDFTRAAPKVREYLVLSRWLNEVVGNLDAWWGQFLVPSNTKTRYEDMLCIDFDEAFSRMPKELMQEVLDSHFGLGRLPLEDTSWRDRVYDMSAPIGFAPQNWDGQYAFYGPLFRDYVLGKLDLDMPAIEKRLEFAGRIPKTVVLNTMQKWLKASRDRFNQWWVELPAAKERKMDRATFETAFTDRVQRSVGEFKTFLRELSEARSNPNHPIHAFYANMPARKY